MKPKRPDSAKSKTTQHTLDTELNISKFSQTFTSQSTFQLQKKDEFQKYIQQKQKDPRFKKLYLQPNLPEILQKPQKPQQTKINSKPFQKRTTSKINSNTKLQQTNKLTESQTSTLGKWTINQNNNNIKKQNKQEMSSSKSFAEKNKQKMNAINSGIKKNQNQHKQLQKKIDLKGFKVNLPGKKVKNNQEQKLDIQNQFLTKNSPNKQTQKRPQTSSKQQKKPQKTAQQIKRQQQLLQISRFINDIQTKNVEYYPDRYEQFIQMNESYMPDDLNNINIQDFLNQPTEKDYEKIQRKIRENQRALLDEEMSESRVTLRNGDLSTEQTSIDLDRIIDGDSQIDDRRQNESQLFLSSISAKDLKERNMFLTQVLKGRVTKENINKLEQMQKSQIKMMKMQDIKKQEDDDIQIMQINMMKKKSNRILDRNMIEASGQVYRDCDYLSEENKQRLERLLNGEVDQSPFQLSEWERFASRRLDEGIRLYRQFSTNLSTEKDDDVISEQCLPKDPILRKEAEKKILKDKIDSINARLRQVDNVVINQSKIKALIENNKSSKLSEASQILIDEKNREFDEILNNKKVFMQLLTKAEKEKSQIQKILKEMQKEYALYEADYKQYEKLSFAEIKQIEKSSLESKKRRLQQIEKSFNSLQKVTEQSYNLFNREIHDQIQILRQLQDYKINNQILVENYHQNQSIQDLDELFIRKVNENPEKINQIKIDILRENKQNLE